jgi:hypothetical protein
MIFSMITGGQPAQTGKVNRGGPASRGFLFWRNLLSPLGVATLHGLIATVLYAPAIFLSQPLLMSTDNIRYLYPQFLFDIRTLRAFDFPSWNQYMQAGIDYPASAYSIVYSPYIWLLSLWPSQRLLDGVTLLTIAHHILAGVFSYLLCVRFVPKRRWALWASIVYVSSGMLIVSQCIYHTFLTYSLLPLVCYLVTCLHIRQSFASITLVSLTLSAVLFCNHPVTTPFVLLSAVLVFALYYRRDLFSIRPGIRLIVTFTVALGLPILITAIRYIPLFDAARNSPRLREGTAWFSEMWQGNYQMVAALVPELLGTRYRTPSDTPGNLVGTLFTDWSYCGIIPLFFFVVGAVYSRAYRSLAVVALLTLAFAMRIKPFADIGFLFMTPRFHPQMIRVSYPLFAVLLMAVGARYCQDRFDIAHRRHLLFFTGFVAAAIAFVGVVYAVAFDTVSVPRALCCLAFAVFAGALAAQRFRGHWERWNRALHWSGVVLTCGSVGAVLIWMSHLQKSAESVSEAGTLVVSILGYLLLSSVIFLGRGSSRREGMFLAMICVTLAAVLTVVAQGSVSSILATSEVRKGLVLLAGIKMATGFGILGQVLALRTTRKMESTRFFCYVCLISIIDLIPFAINYSKYFATSFIPYENLVRSQLDTGRIQQRVELLKTGADLRTYRVNAPTEMLGITQRRFISHIPYVLGLRSYGGFNSLENLWLVRILERFDPKRTRQRDYYGNGTEDDFDSPRLLDLLGVRYDVGPDGRLLERPSALSRFRVFSNYECLADPDAELDRLASPSFDVQGTILLNQCPGFPAVPGPSREASFEELSSGRIRVSAIGPGVLFFGDAFHEGWHPYVNGNRMTLLRANGAFNAVELPSGAASAEWRFEPASFRVGLLVSLAGLLLLAPIAAFWLWSALRRGSSGASRPHRPWRASSVWAFTAVFGAMILAFTGCRVFDSQRSAGSESRPALGILKIQSSVAGDHSVEYLISPGSSGFFEAGGKFPHTVDVELDPSERQGLRTYALVTGNHGDDSLLRMPRGWILYGSNDASSWTVVDKQADSRPWKTDEERLYRLSSAARYRYFRFVFTQSGPVPILRIYRLRFYGD